MTMLLLAAAIPAPRDCVFKWEEIEVENSKKHL